MAFFNPVSNAGLSGSMLSIFDASYTSGLLVPHYLRTLKNKYGDNGLSDFQLLMGLGMKRGVQNTTGWHWEKGFYDAPIALTSVVVSASPSGTANSTITANITSQTGTPPPAGSPNDFIDLVYAKEGQIVMIASHSTLPLGRVRSVIATTTGAGVADIFEVKIDAIENGGFASVASSATAVVVGSAWGEGTNQPSSSQSFWTKYNWQTQIFKETYELTGTQKTNQPQWMEVEYGDGKTKKMNGFFYEGQDEAEYRLIKQIALSMIFGKANTNTNVPTTFSGLDSQIASRGVDLTVGNTLTVQDLREMANAMSKRYSSNLFLLWLTQELYSSLNDSAGAVNTTSANGFGNANVNALNESVADVFFGGKMNDVESLMGTLSYNGLVVDGYNFMIKQARFMQDPNTTAVLDATTAPNLRYRGWAIPLNKMADAEGVLRNRIELVYKEMDGYSRFMEVTDDGRASARKIGQTDVARLYLSSDLGFDFYCLEQFGRLKYA